MPAAHRQGGLAALHGGEGAQPESPGIVRIQPQRRFQALAGDAEKVLSLHQGFGLRQIRQQFRAVAQQAMGGGVRVGGLGITFQGHVGASQQKPTLAAVGFGCQALGQARHHFFHRRLLAIGADQLRRVDGGGLSQALIQGDGEQRHAHADGDCQPRAGDGDGFAGAAVAGRRSALVGE